MPYTTNSAQWSEATLQAHVCLAAYHNGWRITYEESLKDEELASWAGRMLKKIQTFLLKRRRSAFTLAYHTHDSRNSQPGFPDLVMLHPKQNRIIFAELKAKGGYPRLEQRIWLSQLTKIAQARDGVEVYLWDPSNWQDIVSCLGGIDHTR